MSSSEEMRTLGDYNLDELEEDDDDNLWSRTRHKYNQTVITSTVTIRVTPHDDYLVSWAILSSFLVVTIAWASWQVYLERKIDQTRSSSSSPTASSAVLDSDRTTESSSSAEVTRCVFRRLLLFAMLSRFVCIPVMIWSDPVWCQFVGDTLPEMIFATAWTLLVTFFVQVVGIATGTGTNTTPSIVIQLTAYIVYIGLILLELVNSVASVLLYALLCCIYAALLGTIAYFLPRLVGLLRSTLAVYQSLAWRLTVCTVLCALLFAAHMVGFARIVIDPPQKVYWWWNYGCLEILPAICFLIILRPSVHHKDRASSSGEPSSATSSFKSRTGALVRVDSVGSSPSNSPHLTKQQQHQHQQHYVGVAATTTKGATSASHGGTAGEGTSLSRSPPHTGNYGATGGTS